jgi:hypothetical protein
VRNYMIFYTNGTLTVNGKALNITANADNKTYGQVKTYGAGETAFSTGVGQVKTYGAGETAFSTGVGELVNGDTVTSVTLACADGGPATAVVGSYNIIPSAALGSGLNNYNISYHDGTLTVTPATSATALVSSENPSVLGLDVTFTATVTSVPATTPIGSVQFYTNGVVYDGPKPLSGGVASITLADLPIGYTMVDAVYMPDGNFLGSVDSLEQLVHATPETPNTVGIKDNGDGTVTVSFTGTPYVEYVVQASGNVAAPEWTNISTNMAGADGKWTFTEFQGGHTQRFYRSAIPTP